MCLVHHHLRPDGHHYGDVDPDAQVRTHPHAQRSDPHLLRPPALRHRHHRFLVSTLSVRLSVRSSLCPSVHPSVHLFVPSFIHPSVRPSVCPSAVCPSVCPSVRLSLRPFVHPSIRQSDVLTSAILKITCMAHGLSLCYCEFRISFQTDKWNMLHDIYAYSLTLVRFHMQPSLHQIVEALVDIVTCQ